MVLLVDKKEMNVALQNDCLTHFFNPDKTIDSVLERGVKLDNLVERSNDLSAQSKMFYKQAKKTNSCCVIS
jgi:synaptobrevin family protein YKT6